ncbi:unnamed protein product [Psylliodes chrysocephalus]|uniref:Uncharacterized protein n=1 Tax=Psylliodes chrysocephalus TaxID=3402493 RepID=A0A9P0DG54_9CUCU|nr:unnamed protein product [Psylliodes chrysocephala]
MRTPLAMELIQMIMILILNGFLEKRQKTEQKQNSASQMRILLEITTKAADLTGILSRNVAKIATAVLDDTSLVSADEQGTIIDKNKEEEHIAFIEELESKYLGHESLVPPVKVTDISKGLMFFYKRKQDRHDKLYCD